MSTEDDFATTLFAKLLERSAGGIALFHPQRTANGGGEVGDCGYIRRGRFIRLFNVKSPDPALQAKGLPKVQLSEETTLRNNTVMKSEETVMTSGDVSVDVNPGTDTTANMTVARAETKTSAATLHFRDKQHQFEECFEDAFLHDYLVHHEQTIITHYNGREINGLVIIEAAHHVSGWDGTVQWDEKLKAQLTAKSGILSKIASLLGSFSYSRNRTSSVQESNTVDSDYTLNVYQHTTVIRVIKIRHKDWVRRLTGQKIRVSDPSTLTRAKDGGGSTSQPQGGKNGRQDHQPTSGDASGPSSGNSLQQEVITVAPLSKAQQFEYEQAIKNYNADDKGSEDNACPKDILDELLDRILLLTDAEVAVGGWKAITEYVKAHKQFPGKDCPIEASITPSERGLVAHMKRLLPSASIAARAETTGELQRSYDDLVHRSDAEVRQFRAQADEYERIILKLKERLETVAQEHAMELQDVRAQHDLRIRDLEHQMLTARTDARSRINALENHIKVLDADKIRIANEVEERRRKTQLELDRMDSFVERERQVTREEREKFEALRRVHEDTLSKSSSKTIEHQQAVASLQQQHSTAAKALQERLSTSEQLAMKFKSRIDELEQQDATNTQAYAKGEAQWKSRFAALMEEMDYIARDKEESFKRINSEYEKRLSEERSKHGTELKEREQHISTLTGEKQNIEAQLQSQSQQYERLVDSLERERQSTREAREKFEGLRRVHEDTLSESSSKMMEYQQAMTSLQQQHSTAAKALQERLSTSEQLATKFKSRIDELQQQDTINTQTYAKGEAQWKSRFATLTKEMNDIARDKEESFKNWQRTTSGYEERVAEQQRSIDEAERLIARYKRDELKWASAADGHEHTIEGLRADIEEREQEITRLQQQREASDREWKYKVTELQRQIVKLRDTMQQTMDDMQAQIADTTSKSQTRINHVLRESISLIAKYDKRIEE